MKKQEVAERSTSILALASLLTIIMERVVGQKVRTVFENGTSYLSVNALVSLADNGNYSLTLLNSQLAPSVKNSFVPLYEEYSPIRYTNESFVDSFGFRIGSISSTVFQIILTNNTLYLYTFANGTNVNLQLREVNRWNVNALVNTDRFKYYFANTTTTAIQSNQTSAQFMMIVVQNGTINEMLVSMFLDCSTYNTTANCSLAVNVLMPIAPMYFYLISNPSQGVRCQSSLNYLNTEFQDSGDLVADFYFARFCMMSILSVYDQENYKNRVEVYAKYPNSTIGQVHVIDNIYVDGVPYSAQVVNLVEFMGRLLIFNLNMTYEIDARTTQFLSNSSQEFPNAENSYTGYVDCEQNDYNVVSCYLTIYSFPSPFDPVRGVSKVMICGLICR